MADRIRVTGPGEVRAEGRVLSGVVMPYNVTSPSHRERFDPGSLIREPDCWLDLEHDVSRVVCWEGAGVSFTDSTEALSIRAELPRTPIADVALDQVRTGKRTGLSIEFTAGQERREAQTGVRVISLAALYGVGLVARPSYPGAVLEVRRLASFVSGRVNLGRSLPCQCRARCQSVRIAEDAFDDALAEADAGDREVTAFLTGDFGRPVASMSSGTLKVNRTGSRLTIEIDGLPETQVVRDFMAARENTAYTIRPYFPDETSEIVKEGTEAVVSRADLRGIEIAAITGPRAGLEEITVTETRASTAPLFGGYGWL